MRIKRQVTDQNVIFANLISNKEIVPTIYKEITNLIVRNQTINIKNRGKIRTDTSPEEICR